METGKGDPERYLKEYRALLQRTKESLPGVRFILGEPYAIKGVREKIDNWYPGFNEYRTIAAQVAKEFNTAFIPYQEIYDKAAQRTPAGYYSRDGIHPSLAGIELRSEAWCAVINK
jgi:lysophospholipase L1-like esterase